MLSIVPKRSLVKSPAIYSTEKVVARYVTTIELVHGIKCPNINGLTGMSASFFEIYVLTNIHKISSTITQ